MFFKFLDTTLDINANPSNCDHTTVRVMARFNYNACNLSILYKHLIKPLDCCCKLTNIGNRVNHSKRSYHHQYIRWEKWSEQYGHQHIASRHIYPTTTPPAPTGSLTISKYHQPFFWPLISQLHSQSIRRFYG